MIGPSASPKQNGIHSVFYMPTIEDSAKARELLKKNKDLLDEHNIHSCKVAKKAQGIEITIAATLGGFSGYEHVCSILHVLSKVFGSDKPVYLPYRLMSTYAKKKTINQ